LRRIVVIGAGGHARVLIAALKRLGSTPSACLDADANKWQSSILGVPVVGDDRQLDQLGEVDLVNAIGFTRDPSLRRRVWERFHDVYEFVSVRDSSAIVDESVILGRGVQLLAGSIVQTGSSIGANTIVNTGAQIDHDCWIGMHCHIAPGAVLCGDITVGDSTLIGARAVVKQGVSVGTGAIVAMGAVVTRSVPDNAIVLGCPAESR
jgi:sugar O-acyltransferase (sialic acid O-acetyltransferase NeuD family)